MNYLTSRISVFCCSRVYNLSTIFSACHGIYSDYYSLSFNNNSPTNLNALKRVLHKAVFFLFYSYFILYRKCVKGNITGISTPSFKLLQNDIWYILYAM